MRQHKIDNCSETKKNPFQCRFANFVHVPVEFYHAVLFFLENTPIYVLIGNFGFLLPRIIGKEMVSQDKVGAIKSHPRDKHLHNNSVGRCGACVRLLSALCSVRFRCTLCIRPSVPHAVC